MMKSFILAATSIAYLLSIGNNANANNQSKFSRLDCNLACQYKTNLISKYPSPEKISTISRDVISKKDLEDIYKAIELSSMFKSIRTSNLENEPKINGRRKGETRFDEITKLRLTSVHSNWVDKPISKVQVEMTLIRRFYNFSGVVDEWSKERDNLGEFVPTKHHFVFEKSSYKDRIFIQDITIERINGKWEVRE
jgi:hypothetical protein